MRSDRQQHGSPHAISPRERCCTGMTYLNVTLIKCYINPILATILSRYRKRRSVEKYSTLTPVRRCFWFGPMCRPALPSALALEKQPVVTFLQRLYAEFGFRVPCRARLRWGSMSRVLRPSVKADNAVLYPSDAPHAISFLLLSIASVPLPGIFMRRIRIVWHYSLTGINR